MVEEHPRFGGDSIYKQRGGVQMVRRGDLVYPKFEFDSNPAMQTTRSEPGYPLREIPVPDINEYTLENEPVLYPEMNFSRLANKMSGDGVTPNSGYLTHSIHNHPAVFIPHIPNYLIRQFSDRVNERGERTLVLDPFCGSGATGIEAKVNGRDFLGIEVNPLSQLVSEVSTTPIPPTILRLVRTEFEEQILALKSKRYKTYDVAFPEQTDKLHWFTLETIRDLTRIRKVTAELDLDQFSIQEHVTAQEQEALAHLDLDHDIIKSRLNRWLILTIANTVFEVSNADPDISKAHRSPRMNDRIESGAHPPDCIETHLDKLDETAGKLTALWNHLYGLGRVVGAQQTRLSTYVQKDSQRESLDDNQAHLATATIIQGDARAFDCRENNCLADLAITSPPYINAINYYRGTKLRLFWIRDLLGDDEKFSHASLRRSILGSKSNAAHELDADSMFSLDQYWTGPITDYNATRLPHLDEQIEAVRDSGQQDAESKARTVLWFFADGMLKSLTRVYEHLRPGAYFFIIIGENTIGGQLIQSHKYVADIAQHLGQFSRHGGGLATTDGFRFIGSAWDRIDNRALFENRIHGSGPIECEWVVILQKPPGSRG